jgi:hypothetical protein
MVDGVRPKAVVRKHKLETRRLLRFGFGEKAVGAGRLVVVLASHGAQLLHAVGRGGPSCEGPSAFIGRLYHAVVRIVVGRGGGRFIAGGIVCVEGLWKKTK